MIIETTEQTILIKDAESIAIKTKIGLFDKILYLFYQPKENSYEIISRKIIYYPFHIIGAKLEFKRPKMKPRIEYDFICIDGFFGKVRKISGFPQTNNQDIDKSKIVKCKMKNDEAKKISREYFERVFLSKYKKIPEVDIIEIKKIYKPIAIFAGEFKEKKIYKTVDIEVGEKVYWLDTLCYKIEYENFK